MNELPLKLIKYQLIVITNINLNLRKINKTKIDCRVCKDNGTVEDHEIVKPVSFKEILLRKIEIE